MKRNVLNALGASLTLGLMPFFPEPHVVGKVRWVMGGANGMSAMDYGDLLMHGAPWVWLAGALVLWAVESVRGRRQSSSDADVSRR
ncbi:MAG: hypothetical protein DRJ42_27355 [Deltaproteobacteria bacterium]|nr:MAG: hypothetical protein DRJ42_27355 [Deltaproteobacteria bacterium]